jgi:hypothetical protein
VALWWAISSTHNPSENQDHDARTSGAQSVSALTQFSVPDGGKPLPGLESSIATSPTPLFLVRTEPGAGVRDGRALIGTTRDNPQTYRAGALLVNGAYLVEVHADHVVLERRGARVTLYVDGNTRNRVTHRELLTVDVNAASRTIAPTFREILPTYIRPSPVYEGELLKGYQVYSGPRSGVFAQLGLQNGDVIIALGHLPFSDPEQAMSQFGRLTDGAALAAAIDRKGSRVRVVLDGSLIVDDLQRAASPSMTSPAASVPGMVASH